MSEFPLSPVAERKLPLLTLPVGLPRSGKSTLAKRWQSEGAVVVNPDAIRLALTGQRYFAAAEPIVWAIAKLMVQVLFLSGHTWVVLDATNTSRARRAEWFSDKWETAFVEVPTSKEECIRRARASEKTLGVDYCRDLVTVIERMAETYEKPDLTAERPS